MLHDDLGKVLVAFVAGWLMAMGLCWLPRYRGRHVSPEQDMPWYCHGLLAIEITAIAVVTPGPVRWVILMAGAVFLLTAVRKFCERRVQFSLRTLLLVTLSVGVLCSARYYVPLAALFVLVATPVVEWGRLEQCIRQERPTAQGCREEAHR